MRTLFVFAMAVVVYAMLPAPSAMAQEPRCQTTGKTRWYGHIGDGSYDCRCATIGSEIVCDMKDGDTIEGDVVVHYYSGKSVVLKIAGGASIKSQNVSYYSDAIGYTDKDNELIVFGNGKIIFGQGAKFDAQDSSSTWGGIVVRSSGRFEDYDGKVDSIKDVIVYRALKAINIYKATRSATVESTNPGTYFFSYTNETSVHIEQSTGNYVLKNLNLRGRLGVSLLDSTLVTIDGSDIHNGITGTIYNGIDNTGTELKLTNGTTIHHSSEYGVRTNKGNGTAPKTTIADSSIRNCKKVCVDATEDTLVIDNSILDGSDANNPNGTADHDGIVVNSGTVTVKNGTLVKNFEKGTDSAYQGACIHVVGGEVIVDGATLTNCEYGIFAQSGGRGTADIKLTVKNSVVDTHDVYGIYVQTKDGQSNFKTASTEVSSSQLSNTADDAIHVREGTLTVTRNRFKDIGDKGVVGQLGIGTTEISNNHMLHVNNGIYWYPTAGSQVAAKFYNNSILTDGTSTNYGIQIYPTTPGTAYPLIYGNVAYGFSYAYYLPTAWKTGSANFAFNNGGGSRVAPFRFHDSTTSATEIPTANTVDNPQFVDPTNGDLRLKGTSPLRDVMTIGTVTTDLDGRPRLGQTDIGCHETPGIKLITPYKRAQGTTTTVTVSGSNFVSGKSINFTISNVTDSLQTYVNSTTISARFVVSASAPTGKRDVVFAHDGFNDTLVDGLEVTAAITASSVSPSQINEAEKTRSVTINGTNFAAGETFTATFVRQGGGASYTLTGVTRSSSTVLSGAFNEANSLQDGTYDLTVTNTTTGATATKTAALVVTKLVVSAIAPPQVARTSAGNTTYTVTGTFVPNQDHKLYIRLVGATDSGYSSAPMHGVANQAGTQISFTLSAMSSQPEGNYEARVTNLVDNGYSPWSGAALFTITNPLTITDLTPTSIAKGQTKAVTVTGTNIQSGVIVTLVDQTGKVTIEGTPVVSNQTSSTPVNVYNTITFNVKVDAGAGDGVYNLTFKNPDDVNNNFVRSQQVIVGDQPVIGGFDPPKVARGLSNFKVTINGANFNGATPEVTFACSGVTQNGVNKVDASKIELTLTVAASATLGACSITVKDAGAGGSGLTTQPKDLQIVAAPTITSVTPNTGGQGATRSVVIIGSGFDDAAGVDLSFGAGIKVQSIQELTATKITALIAVDGDASAGTRTVSVTNKTNGLSAVTKPQGFTVAPGPTITDVINLYPSHLLGQGALALPVKITGTTFALSGPTPNVEIIFYRKVGSELIIDDGIEIVANSLSGNSTTLNFTVNLTSAAVLGQRWVRVTNNSDGGSVLWEKTAANVTLDVSPRPIVTSFSITTVGQGAKDFALNINGSNFPNAVANVDLDFGSDVTVNVKTATASKTGIQVTVKPDATKGPTTLTYVNKQSGARTQTDGIGIVAAPTITEVTPDAVKQGLTSFPITLNGSGFTTNVTVTLSGDGDQDGTNDVIVVANSVTRISATQVTFQIDVPVTAAIRTVDVTLVNTQNGGRVTKTGAFSVTINNPPIFNPVPPDQTINLGSLVFIIVRSNDVDPGDAVSLSASDTTMVKDANGNAVTPPTVMQATFSDNGDGNAIYSFAPTVAGEYQVTFTLSSAGNLTAQHTITIKVVDEPPVTEFPENPKCVDGYQKSYTVKACDPSGQEVTVAVNVTLNGNTTPVTVTKDENDSCLYHFTLDCKAGMSVSITVGDGTNSTQSNFDVAISANAAPSAPVFVTPEDLAEVPNGNLSFTNSVDQTPVENKPTTYTCRYSTTSDFQDGTVVELNVDESEGGKTDCVPEEGQLEDNKTYYIKIVAKDGADPTLTAESEVREVFVNTANDAPGVPVQLTPSDGSSVNSLFPALAVTNATDVDGDTLTLEFQISLSATFDTLVEEIKNVPQDAGGTTNGLTSLSLVEDTVYFWRVRAVDEHGLPGAWSPVWKFRVNTDDQIPTVPVLKSPSDAATVTSTTPELCFNNAIDGDGDVVSYVLQLATESTFAANGAGFVEKSLSENASGVTCWTVETALTENAKLYWRVRASDGTNLSDFSAAWTFVVNMTNEPPTAPELVSPKDSVELGTATNNVFTFKNASDPDGDALTYTITVFSDEAGTQVVLTKAQLQGDASGQTAITVADSIADGTYWWQVTASDPSDGSTKSVLGKFTIKSSSGNSTSNAKKGGGCDSVQAANSPMKPLWLLLFALGFGLLWYRRRQSTL